MPACLNVRTDPTVRHGHSGVVDRHHASVHGFAFGWMPYHGVTERIRREDEERKPTMSVREAMYLPCRSER